jgi:cyclic beta-1,2-glucan synthetase
MDKALASDYRTAVIVPVIFRHAGEVALLMQRLERHWLSNADPEIRLALLSDFSDAPEQVMPGDDAIETALCEGIRALNRR